MATYNDATRTITISKEELINVDFKNLYSVYQTLGLTPYMTTTIGTSVYNSINGEIKDSYYGNHSVIYWSNDGIWIRKTNVSLDGFLTLYNTQTETESREFIFDLVLTINEEYYNKIKNAILLDSPVPFPELVNEDDESETPSTLVGDNLGLITSQEEIDALLQYRKHTRKYSKLTPNPAGFGFSKQYKINELPDITNGEPNTLYLVCVYNDGILVGYRPYRWTPTEGYTLVFNTNTPNFKAENGARETPVITSNEARVIFEHVFHGKVAFLDDIYWHGLPLLDYIDQKGGVTHDELDTILDAYAKKTDLPPAVTANPTLAGTEPNLTGLQVGTTKYQLPKVNLYKHSVTLVEHYEGEEVGIYRTYNFEFISNSATKLCENANLLTFGTNYNAAFPTMINPTVHCDDNSDDPIYNGDFRIVSLAGDATYLYFNTINESGAFVQIQIKYEWVTSQVYTDVVTPYGSSAESALNSVIKLTNAPTAANTSGRLIFVILDSDPATKYDGYFYFITGSNA